MIKRIKFTKEQQDFMRNNYLTMTNQEISNYFNDPNINKNKVGTWLKNNGCRRGKGFVYEKDKLFSEYDKEFMRNNYLNLSYRKIAENLGFSERQVRSWLNNNGYLKYRKINEHYFENIDTSLKAYLLGFIFADGWIVANPDTRSYEFGMELQSEDKYVLETINNELGGLNIIYHSEEKDMMICGNMCHKNSSDILRVYSKPLVLDLIKNGIATNKTLKDIHPEVSEEYFFDWLRGYIDGDGCFWKYKNHYYMHITCAMENTLIYIQDKLKTYNIETRLYKEADRKYRLMCVNIDEMKKLVSHLYYKDDLFYLTRKYEKVKYYLGFAA